MTNDSHSLTEWMDRMPPAICRIFAKSKRHYMTDAEMMAVTGWSEVKLKRISSGKTWKNISVGDIDCYLHACGLSWSRMRRPRWLLHLAVKRGGLETMRHLRGATRIQKIVIKKHLKRLTTILAN